MTNDFICMYTCKCFLFLWLLYQSIKFRWFIWCSISVVVAAILLLFNFNSLVRFQLVLAKLFYNSQNFYTQNEQSYENTPFKNVRFRSDATLHLFLPSIIFSYYFLLNNFTSNPMIIFHVQFLRFIVILMGDSLLTFVLNIFFYLLRNANWRHN